MERRNELKAKARELEHADQPAEALVLYEKLLERSGESGPLIWSRIGELQLGLGHPSAGESLAKAIEGFVEAGQRNNAIAIARLILESGAGDGEIRLLLGKLATEQGYRAFAREALAERARAGAAEGEAEPMIEPIGAFLLRYPDEQALWREWAQTLASHGHESAANEVLTRLARILGDAGHSEVARRIEAELGDLRSQGRAAIEPVTDPFSDVGADADAEADADALPLLEGTAPPAVPQARQAEPPTPSEAPSIAPIEGLQTTHVDTNWAGGDEEPSSLLPAGDLPAAYAPEDGAGDRSETLEGLEVSGTAEPAIAEELPALGRSGIDALGRIEIDEAIEEATDEEPEPLPLLGTTDVPPAVEEPVGGPEHPAAFDVGPLVEELGRHTSATVSGAEDASTRYDLGLAYKEMGLIDEALAQLAGALASGHDPAATLEVVGEILVDRGEYEATISLLRPLLRSPRFSEADLVGVSYWLARGQEELGRQEEARRAYQNVVSTDPTFRDATVRLDRLSASF